MSDVLLDGKWIKAKQFDNTAIGEGWILADLKGGKRRLVKLIPEGTTKDMMNNIIERIEHLKCKEIAGLVKYEGSSQECKGTLLYFEHSSITLSSLVKREYFRNKQEELISLFIGLLKMCRKLQLRGEYHPSICAQNIYLDQGRFFILNPFLYDSYIASTSNPKQTTFTTAVKQHRLPSDSHRHASNIRQSAMLVMSACLAIDDADVRSAIDGGCFEGLLLVDVCLCSVCVTVDVARLPSMSSKERLWVRMPMCMDCWMSSDRRY